MKTFRKVLCILFVCLFVAGSFPLIVFAQPDNGTVRYTVLLLDTELDFEMYDEYDYLLYLVDTPVDTIKKAAHGFTKQLLDAAGQNYIAVLTYSSSVKVECGFTDSESTLTRALNGISEGGQWADINSALKKADALLSEVQTPDAEKNIVLFTQGINFEGSHSESGVYSEDDCTWQRMDNEVAAYAYSNVTYKTAKNLHKKYNVYSIGLFQSFAGLPLDGMNLLNFAKRFASDIQNKGFYDVADPDDLPLVFESVADNILNPLEVMLYHTRRTVQSSAGAAEYIEITLYAFIQNKSKETAVGTKIRIDDLGGLKLLNAGSPLELKPGDIPAEEDKDVYWKLRAPIPEGEKSYQVKIVASSENSVAIEQYETVTVSGDISANQFGEHDRWSFVHYLPNYQIDAEHLSPLLDRYEQKERDKLQTKYTSITQPNAGWGGSCHGLSLAALLFKLNRLTPSEWDEDADLISDLRMRTVSSMVNYYFLMQWTPEHQAIKKRTVKMNDAEALRALEEELNDSAVMFGFDWTYKYSRDCVETLPNGQQITHKKGDKEPAGHTILAYGTPESSENGWTVNGVRYHNRIHLYDINTLDSQLVYSPSYLFYEITDGFFVDSAEWTVAKESAPNVYIDLYFTPSDPFVFHKKQINFISNDITELDVINIEDASLEADVILNTQSMLIANNLTTKLRVMNESGKYTDIDGLVSDGEFTLDTYYDTLYVPGSHMIPSLNILLDEEEAYTVLNTDNAPAIDFLMQYEDVYTYVYAENGTEVSFRPDGAVGLTGENASYRLTMVFDEDDSTTPWYKTTVEGSGANEIFMEQTRDGIVVTGDNLENLTIRTFGEDGEEILELSTDGEAMLITASADDRPTAFADTDGDGEFETRLASSLFTAAALQRFFSLLLTDWIGVLYTPALLVTLLPRLLWFGISVCIAFL